MMDIQTVVLAFEIVRVISIAMDSDVAKPWVLRKPLLWPKARDVSVLAPRFPRVTPKTMNKYEVDMGVGIGV
jgi:hypothetical protein